jgi:hypothetical protein
LTTKYTHTHTHTHTNEVFPKISKRAKKTDITYIYYNYACLKKSNGKVPSKITQ